MVVSIDASNSRMAFDVLKTFIGSKQDRTAQRRH